MKRLKEKFLNFILSKILPTDEGIVLKSDTRTILNQNKTFDLYGDTIYEFIGMVNNLDRWKDNQLEDFIKSKRNDRLRYWFLFNRQFVIKDLDGAIYSLFKAYTKLNDVILELERNKTYTDESRLYMLRKLRKALWLILKEFLA